MKYPKNYPVIVDPSRLYHMNINRRASGDIAIDPGEIGYVRGIEPYPLMLGSIRHWDVEFISGWVRAPSYMFLPVVHP